MNVLDARVASAGVMSPMALIISAHDSPRLGAPFGLPLTPFGHVPGLCPFDLLAGVMFFLDIPLPAHVGHDKVKGKFSDVAHGWYPGHSVACHSA